MLQLMKTDFSQVPGVIKRIRPWRDCSRGRLHLKGPTIQRMAPPANPVPENDLCLNGQQADVDQAVAYELVIRQNACALIEGQPVTITEFPDGAHGYIPWMLPNIGVYDGRLGLYTPEVTPLELVKVLNPPEYPYHRPVSKTDVWPNADGTLMRIVLANHPFAYCFLGEPTEGKQWQVQRVRNQAAANVAREEAEDRAWVKEQRRKQSKIAEATV
jgi:hypothetical protein